jgi:small neutral amino acid transporter SnatA (MarC family)
MPFIAGPCAITFVVPSTQRGNMHSLVMALVALGVVLLALVLPVLFLIGYLSKISERAMNVIT